MRYTTIFFFLYLCIYTTQLLSEPIPADIIFASPQRENIQISPDGRYISYIAKDQNGKNNLFLKTPQKNDDRRLIANPEEGIIDHRWSLLPDKILYFQRLTSQNSVHLFLLDVKSGLIRDLTPLYGRDAKALITDHRVPDTIFCAIETQQEETYDLHSINLRNGATEKIVSLPEKTIEIKADIFHGLLIVSTLNKKEMKIQFSIKYPQDEHFIELLSIGFLDEFRIIDFSEDGRSIFALSNLNRDYISLVRYDLEQKKEVETLLSSDRSDIDELYYNSYKRAPIAAAFDFIRREISVFDTSSKGDFDFLDKQRRGGYRLHSMDLKGEKWIISFETYDTPRSYYLYNRTDRRIQILFLENPSMEKYKPIKSQPFTIRHGEREKLLLFVTLPQQHEAENFPLILNLYNPHNKKHGFEFQPICQFFASRGFACITFEYSGIAGFGKDKYVKGYNRDGIKRRNDEMITIIRWAIDRNIAHPQQITVLADSINSIPTLNALIENPDIIQTAIFIEPTFDTRTFKSRIEIAETTSLFSDRNKFILIKNMDEANDLLSQIKKASGTMLFMLNKKASLYDYGKTDEAIMETKKQSKKVISVSYPDRDESNFVDFMRRTENIISRYYNTDYIDYKPDSKREIEVKEALPNP